MTPLEGIVAPVPTPFGEGEELALSALRDNLRKWCATRLAGFAILGSTGEYVYLTTEEKKAVLDAAREAVPEGRLLIAGTGSESTRATIALTRWAGEQGYDYAMVVTPSYYKKKMDARSAVAHYTAVAEASPIPVILYNVPIFTGWNLPVDAVVALARHPNVAGIKDSAGDVLQLQEICDATPESFAVLTGSASLLLAGLTVGARGAILAAANVAYDLAVDLYEAFRAGDLPRARALQARLAPINRAVTSEHGIAGLKALLDRIGYYGGPPRRPLLPVDEAAVDALHRTFEESCRPGLASR